MPLGPGLAIIACRMGNQTRQNIGVLPPKQRILVVDDDPAIRSLVCQVLAAEGYEVDSACSGLEAMDFLEQIRPDLLITDVMMPVFDGGILLNIMHARFGNRAAPALGITALPTLKRESDIHFLDVLQKPFDIDALIATVRRILAETDPEQGGHIPNPTDRNPEPYAP
jgi:two-component system, OmpR family, alkaline phosphatase synthesis response regulator PhoP